MFIEDYNSHKDAKLNTTLLWEFDLEASDFSHPGMRRIIVERVVERGAPEDWYAILNMYGVELVKSTIKELPYMNHKDSNFVSLIFDIPKNEMKCYTKKQWRIAHWNY